MTETIWHPGKILETSGYYWKSCALHTAVKLNLFTILGDVPLTGNEVAQKAEVDEDAVTRLLDALTAMGLLVKTGRQYKNTKESADFLVETSATYIGYMILHHHFLVDAWQRLDISVQTGKPVESESSIEDEAGREAFLMGMYNNALLIAPDLVKALDLSGRKKMLDMGGGPGTYAIFFCREYPGLTATVFDLPTTRPFAERVIHSHNMLDIIDFSPGNYLDDDLPRPFDIVWMSHILHGEGTRDCRNMIGKVHDALEPGGMVAIHDFFLAADRSGPLFPALFSLNMLVGTPQGRAYTDEEVINMLQDAGFTSISRLSYQGPNDAGIITGIK